MIRIAVTGSTGFIGRHVLKELEKHDVEVIGVTREIQRGLPEIRNGHWLAFDLKNGCDNLLELLGRPDVLIHLAWSGLPNYNSLHHFEIELPIQYYFLKRIVAEGLKTLLVAGTCFEYGMQFGPLSENMNANPTNPYGLAKKTLYRQLVFLNASMPFNLIWPRIFYVYGKGQAENSLYSQLQSAVAAGKVFNMSGGEQLRDYLPVEFIAKSIVLLALKQSNIGLVNVCSGNPISVRALVEHWIQDNNWDLKLNLGYYSYPEYEPMAFWGARGKFDKIFENE